MSQYGKNAINPNTWWYRATERQRMAQVLGAIECGMTMAQLTMNVHARNPSAIKYFCDSHSINWPKQFKGRVARFGYQRKRRASEYYRGVATEEAAMLNEGFRMLSADD